MMRKILTYFFALNLLFAFHSCDSDNDDATPAPVYPDANKSISDLRALVSGDEGKVVPKDFIFKGTVISNQGKSNNFSNAIFVQNGNQSVKINCDIDGEKFYETLKEGKEIAVKADGLFLTKINETYVLGFQRTSGEKKVTLISEETLKKIVSIGDYKQLIAKEINDISSLTSAMVGTLVKINNVQVEKSDLKKKVATEGKEGSTELVFVTKKGKKIKLSTSNSANFRNQIVPEGSGSIEGILLSDGTDYMISIRGMQDLVLSGKRFTVEGGVTPPGNNDFKNMYNGYYKNVTSYTMPNLKTVLHDIIDGNKIIPYTDNKVSMDVWRALQKTDEDPNNSSNVILLYTGRSIPKSHMSKNNQPDYWNREHVWAKSRGFGGSPSTSKPASVDIHHLRPTDASVNSARGNKWFDDGGAPHAEATLCKTDSDSWEPRDAVKGDVARMLFYMVVRYESKADDGVDLELTNNPQDNEDPNHGILSTLIKWHKADPVDAFEKKRNDVIYSIQGNRNPFVDFPDFANYIFKSK
jgi:endonuclease I